jgi:phosphate acyltransferase
MNKKTEEKKIIKIAFDVMSGDFGCEYAVEATLNFLVKNPWFNFVLIGDSKKIIHALTKNKEVSWLFWRKKIYIEHTDQVLNMNDDILSISRKKDSSLSKACLMLKNEEVDGMITAGSTKLILFISHQSLKKIGNIKKIAFMPFLPSIKNKELILLDAGANLEIEVYDLIMFACIGTVYAKKILNREKPKISLLNIAKEKNKGRKLEINTYHSLMGLNEKKILNFFGNIEARDVLKSDVDVIITDGYSGNIFLKSIEGMVETIFFLLKSNYQNAPWWKKFFYLFLKKDLKKIKNKYFYQNSAAAPLVGIEELLIKVHGNAKTSGYLKALELVKTLITDQLNQKLNQEIKIISEKCKYLFEN